MASRCAAIGPAAHDVHVDPRLPLIEGDVAQEREHLHLLPDDPADVVSPGAIEEADRDAGEGADPAQRGRAQIEAFGRRSERLHRVVVAIAHQHEGSPPVDLVHRPDLHGMAPQARSATAALSRLRRPTRQATRTPVMTVSSASSIIANRNAVSPWSIRVPNSAVMTRMRRTGAIMANSATRPRTPT